MNLRQKAKRFKKLYEKTLPQRENPDLIAEKRVRTLCVQRIVREYEPIEFAEKTMIQELATEIQKNDFTRTTYKETPMGTIIRKEIQIVDN